MNTHVIPPAAGDPASGAECRGTAGTRLLERSVAALATHYCDLLAFEWRQRRRRSESTSYGFAHLCRWDDRIGAYLKGIALLGRQGMQSVRPRLADPITDGEFFALSMHAITARETDLMCACIGLVQAMSHFSNAFSSALEWADWPGVEFALSHWPAEDPLRQSVVLRSIAAHEVTVATDYALQCASRLSPHPLVQLSALRCALARGEAGWAANAPALLDASHSELRLAAAEAVLVFGDRSQRSDGLARLRDLALGRGRTAALATRELVTLQCREADELLEALRHPPDRIRQRIVAMGWSGDLSHLPNLVEYLDHPALARLAAAALGELTGSSPRSDLWEGESMIEQVLAIPDESSIPRDVDAELPWPDRDRFAAWWNARRRHYTLDARYLAGLPRDAGSLLRILRHGRLSSRPQAAWLAQLSCGGRRLAHMAPAFRQRDLMDHIQEAPAHG